MAGRGSSFFFNCLWIDSSTVFYVLTNLGSSNRRRLRTWETTNLRVKLLHILPIAWGYFPIESLAREISSGEVTSISEITLKAKSHLESRAADPFILPHQSSDFTLFSLD